jgi:hypothetical protein
MTGKTVGVNGRIILEWIFRKLDRKMWGLDASLRIGTNGVVL